MSPLRWSRWGLLSLFCTAGAWAAEGDDPAALFNKLDANSDGQLTVEEVSEEHRPHFDRLLRRGDKDENKTLTKEEFLAAHAPDAAPEAPAAPQGPGGGGRPNRPNGRREARQRLRRFRKRRVFRSFLAGANL